MYWTKLAGLPRLLSSPFCGWQGSQKKESWTVFTQLSRRSFGGLPQECEGESTRHKQDLPGVKVSNTMDIG